MSARQAARLAVALGVAFAAVMVITFGRAHWDSIYDDAFIYLRYVKNLKAGCGARFNCDGPAVEGFTGPLYLATLTAGSLVTTHLVDLCQALGTACLIAATGLAVVTAAAIRRADDAPSWTPVALALGTALCLGLDPFVELNANIGMETAMAAALISAVAFAAVTERPWLLVASACAAMLVRPEALLFVVAMPVLPWMRRRKYLLAAAAVIAAVTLARWLYFGELAPNTYYAKSGGTMRHFELGLAYIADAFTDFPLSFLAPLALLGVGRRNAGYLLVVIAGWLAFFLRSGGDLFEYSRLWFPLVPACTVLALAGLAELGTRAGALLARRFPHARLAVTLGLPLVVAIGVGARAAGEHAIPEQHANPRVVEWIATGTYLRTHFPKGTLVACVPIGAIGYYSQLPILDLVGLTEPAIALEGRSVPPELLTKLWIGHERNFTEYVLARAPDVIATTMHRDHAWASLDEAKAGFWADWLVLQEIRAGRAPYHVYDAEVSPGDHMLMFVRDASAPPRE